MYFQLFSDLSKIIITNGMSNFPQTEIINLNSSFRKCNSVDDYPLELRGTVGGLISNKVPIVCGGQVPPTNLCSQLIKGKWTSGKN
jgi:hypothetical protein